MFKNVSAKLGFLLTALVLIISIIALLSLNGSLAWLARNSQASADGFSVVIDSFAASGTIESYGVLGIENGEYEVENELDENGKRKQVFSLPLNDPNKILYSKYSMALLVCININVTEATDVVLTVETPNTEVTTELENHLSNCIQITPASYDEQTGKAIKNGQVMKFVTVENNTCQKETSFNLFSGHLTSEEDERLYFIIEYNEDFIDYINGEIIASGKLANEETKYYNDITFVIR